MEPERIELTTPLGKDWEPVIRLVLGGVGDRLDLGFEELDDLQLAVERLLAEAGAQRTVSITLELTDRRQTGRYDLEEGSLRVLRLLRCLLRLEHAAQYLPDHRLRKLLHELVL